MNAQKLINSKKWRDLWPNNTELRIQVEMVVLEAAIEEAQQGKEQIKKNLEKLLGLNNQP